MKKKICLACGKQQEKLTKDHVVPRVVLRDLMGVVRYSRFCSVARKVNLQPLCGPCNGRKGSRVIDYREQFRHDELRSLLKNWNIKVKFEDSSTAALYD